MVDDKEEKVGNGLRTI